MSDALKFFFAFVVVLALIGLVAWALRRFAAGRVSTAGGRGRAPRLAVIDAAKVDNRRLLVLVRRDNVEHLLMIGGPTDFVVESNIARAGAQGRDLPRQPVPDQSWIEPELPPEPMPIPEPPPRMSRPPVVADEPRRAPPVAPMPAPPMPAPPPMVERRPEPMTGFVPESITRPPQTRAEPPPIRRAEKPPAPPVRPPQPQPRPEAPAIASPAAEAMSQADKNLAEMAQRLEAALRAPGTAPRAEPPPIVPNKVDRVGAPSVAPEAAPARPAPPPEPPAAAEPAGPPAGEAKPSTGFESLEAEMASLLGRPKTPS